MPEVFGHKPSRYAFEERSARDRAFDKTAEPVRSTALIADADPLTSWTPSGANAWDVPTFDHVLQTALTDTDLWEQPDARPCFHYVGGQSIWVQLEYSGWIRRNAGGTLGAFNFLIYTIGLNVGVGVPVSGDQLLLDQQQMHWTYQNDVYVYNFVRHDLIVPDTYIAPMFLQWFLRLDQCFGDMNFSVLATRSEHG